MAEITVAADLDSLNDVLAFVDGEMERAGCSMKLMTQVDMAVEEIFVNIARYAYHPEAGEASVRCEAGGDPFQIVVGFADRGRPFNPLDREDPDVTLDAEARRRRPEDVLPGAAGVREGLRAGAPETVRDGDGLPVRISIYTRLCLFAPRSMAMKTLLPGNQCLENKTICPGKPGLQVKVRRKNRNSRPRKARPGVKAGDRLAAEPLIQQIGRASCRERV